MCFFKCVSRAWQPRSPQPVAPYQGPLLFGESPANLQDQPVHGVGLIGGEDQVLLGKMNGDALSRQLVEQGHKVLGVVGQPIEAMYMDDVAFPVGFV